MTCVAILAASVGLLTLNWLLRRTYAHEWHATVLGDGMQRRVGDDWQHREMTDAERADHTAGEAW